MSGFDDERGVPPDLPPDLRPDLLRALFVPGQIIGYQGGVDAEVIRTIVREELAAALDRRSLWQSYELTSEWRQQWKRS